jgi:2-dehydropantoate 2-reductase
MNFVVLGAGALGSIYAAYLARGGHDVSLIARGTRGAGLAEHGIAVTGQESFSIRCNVVTQPESLRRTDVLIVAIKTYDTADALARLGALKADRVFSVQNGVLKNNLLGDVFGQQHTLGAISMIGGDVLPAENGLPGAVRYNMAGPTIIGEPSGGQSDRVQEIVDAFTQSGLKAQSS